MTPDIVAAPDWNELHGDWNATVFWVVKQWQKNHLQLKDDASPANAAGQREHWLSFLAIYCYSR